MDFAVARFTLFGFETNIQRVCICVFDVLIWSVETHSLAVVKCIYLNPLKLRTTIVKNVLLHLLNPRELI